MEKILSGIIIITCIFNAIALETVKGHVFIDVNKNGVYDLDDTGLQGVLVSNGVDVVETNENGRFKLKRVGHMPVFLIKPSGYQVTKSKDGQPLFYEEMTSKNNDELQFGLFKKEEDDKLKIALLGDTQPHNVDEVYYVLRSGIDELKREVYDFSITLGDVVSDNPVILPLIKQVIAASGRASYFTFGNHDLNWEKLYTDGLENWDKDWINAVGPTYYAMAWGKTNILNINNINVKLKANNEYGYDYYMKNNQMLFIKNYLSHLDKNELLIITSHCKPDQIVNDQEFYNLFKGFSKVLFTFGHHHRTENYKITKEQGWPNEIPAHFICAGAICGGHWRGEEDIFGIPSALMTDGSPKGYVFLDIAEGSYKLTYKASGMPDEKQMHIYTPDYLFYDTNFKPLDPTPNNSFYVNIYLGSEETKVEYRIDGGKWFPMQKVNEPDPYLKKIMMRQKLGVYPTEGSRKLKREYDNMTKSSHLWKVSCPSNLTYGVHELEVRFTDAYIKNSSEKHSFIYITPEMKEVNKKMNSHYKKWVSNE
ncbi:hypothetical protein APS56_15785 [Pseudalgibacter alginicilyticus]|uniref:Metallophosphoesterase n=1 Tax=Pseudalgibacter alginicilyticus TaxID=1736674 RepID=A0A0P0DED7_9FLAO|nr:calcineurin-like phosphoesterase C-terminal domain-containing protein [Pseudalgibacter alginicilyticus]ALJ06506.1 hypothetical protein APS56_15785 [Pseudalgibacter alginicilyticus]